MTRLFYWRLRGKSLMNKVFWIMEKIINNILNLFGLGKKFYKWEITYIDRGIKHTSIITAVNMTAACNVLYADGAEKIIEVKEKGSCKWVGRIKT